ncbi:helix-turn-helix transcriptional regulator [Oligoflexus tunisiensis]|uniref:helix-turn-helix transcriptional regulator n=1 Tax=Oligoflexus tunisiensis TaxID=708132 RepID=UPI00114CE1C6|nr:helix-turn-helix transcriptional regulator [Oligoflexus tunisiensis]
MEIGNFVRAERKRQGLTQQQLAARSGVGLNFVYQLEKNKASVQLDSVNQVLRALGYQIGVIRDFRPWDQDYTVPRAGATAAVDEADLEAGAARFLPPADLEFG